MRPADTWKDYELLDATDGNRRSGYIIRLFVFCMHGGN